MKFISLWDINKEAERQCHYWWRLCWCLLIGLLATGCVKKIEVIYRPSQVNISKNSYLEAKNTIKQLWEANNRKVKFMKNFVVLIETDSNNDKDIFAWDLKKINDPYVTSDYCIVTDHGFIHTSHIKGKIYNYDYGFYRLRTLSKATAFANALYVLKHDAGAAAEVAFADGAKKFREMPVKPALSEDVQRFRIMAEDAFQNKEFEKAVDYYEQGLEIQPLWPEGQFNAALLCGELKDYENAALHMKRYLELVPNAKDAKEAREKIYLWEGKAKEVVTK